MDIFLLIYGFFAAVTASLVGAFSGGGSSLIILPLLLMISGGQYVAMLTVTKINGLAMTLVSGRIHFGRHNINWRLFTVINVFGLLGTALGTYLVQFQPNEELFKNIMGFVLLMTAIYIIYSRKLGSITGEHLVLNKEIYIMTAIFSFFLNILNGIFGGTGIFLTFFLVAFVGMSFIRAVAYTMISYALINIFQTGYLVLTVNFDYLLGFVILIGSLVGSWLGTHLQYLKGDVWVKRATVTVMILIGVKMFF